jgi:glutathione S-transferase
MAHRTPALRASLSSRRRFEDRVAIIAAKTRAVGSPYYQINPSGRVPYLVDDAGVGMEDSQLICAYLDGLDDKPRFHSAARAPTGRIFGSSLRRAACATVSRYGRGKWLGPRANVRRPLSVMS